MEKPRLKISSMSREGDYIVEGVYTVRFWARGPKLSETARMVEAIQRKLPTALDKLGVHNSREGSYCSSCYIKD